MADLQEIKSKLFEDLKEFTDRTLQTSTHIAQSSDEVFSRLDAVYSWVEMVRDTVRGALPLLENQTPIEEKFAWAMSLHFRSIGWEVWSDFDDAQAWADRYASSYAMQGISHQVKIPKLDGTHYRVDFLLCAKPFSDLAKPIFLIVECDGHDFHEKTKEQAAADKKRDRDLVAQGFSVLRFTGSEIWSRAEECADEVAGLLLRLQHESIERLPPRESANVQS